MRSLQILHTFVLRAEKITTFEPKVVKTSARNTKTYKICKFRTAIFSSFYNISRPNFGILLIFKDALSSCGGRFRSSCLD